MNYLKKVCVFKEICSGYTYSGKVLTGMIKCEQINSSVKISLSVSNLAPSKSNYYLAVKTKNGGEIFEITKGQEELQTSVDIIDISAPFCAGIILPQESKVICYASTPSFIGKSQDLLNFYFSKTLVLKADEMIEDEIEKALKGEEISPYADDTLATENYYENADVDIENLSVKEVENVQTNQNETFNGANFNQEKEKNFEDDAYSYDDANCECFTAIEDVENVLNSFDRYDELEKIVYGSVWVTVPLDKGEYYFGKAQIGEEKYLCYAVKGQRRDCPEELKELACFIPCAPYKQEEGYFVMFQDAQSGKVIKKN